MRSRVLVRLTVLAALLAAVPLPAQVKGNIERFDVSGLPRAPTTDLRGRSSAPSRIPMNAR